MSKSTTATPEKKMSRRERRAKTGAGPTSTRDELTEIEARVNLSRCRRNPSTLNVLFNAAGGVGVRNSETVEQLLNSGV